MSKRWILGAILIATCSGTPVFAQQTLSSAAPPTSATASVQPVELAIIVGGQVLENDAPPVMVDGRVLIPLRKVFNALGASVKYENKVISAARGKQTVELSPGVKSAKINGQEVTLDVPPILVGTVTYVPLRFVAQALGDSVLYEAAKKQITVVPQEAVATSEDPAALVPLDKIEVIKLTLKRLAVGNQGAILKLWNKDSSEVAYYRGLDDRDTAPYSDKDREAILAGLDYEDGIVDLSGNLMNGFSKLPRREAVALLGLIHSIPDDSSLNPPRQVDRDIESFLIEVLKTDKDVVVRRQACLALAVSDALDDGILDAILDFYSGSENLWETFPVQQFFQYKAARIRSLPTFTQVRERVAAVNSLYTDPSLRYLDGAER